MKQNIPTIKDIKDLKGKRVVLRLDFNVPIENGKIVETMRIDRALPTIEYLVKKKARVIILSHIGHGVAQAGHGVAQAGHGVAQAGHGVAQAGHGVAQAGKDASSSLKPVVRYLNKKMNVGFVPDFRAPQARVVVDSLPEGGIVIFENLRMDDRETKNDPAFAKYLASFGDLYVNDAFAVSHRAHASVVGITKYLPSYIGFLIADEIKNLSLALKPKHPFLFILGGAKFGTKAPLLKKFLTIADKVFVGGVLANDFFHDAGFEVGKSTVDDHDFKLTPLLKKGKIILPIDVVVTSAKNKKGTVKYLGEVESGDSIIDAGPETIKMLTPVLKKAKLIVWNGPLGYYEGGFDKGTIALLKAIADTKATSIIGGGDTAVIVEKLGLDKKLSFVSTGGGATLDYLADGKLPALDAILKCKKN